jgi:hypothetical protein
VDFVILTEGRGEMSSIWQYAWLSLSGAQRRALRETPPALEAEVVGLLGVVEKTLSIVKSVRHRDEIAKAFLVDLVER